MSYDLSLWCPYTDKPIWVGGFKHDLSVGNYSPTDDGTLNFNFLFDFTSALFEYLDDGVGVASLFGKNGREAAKILRGWLFDDRKGTNMGPKRLLATRSAIRSLLSLAILRPDGVWHGGD